MSDGDIPFPAGAEGKLGARIEGIGIDALADGHRANDFAAGAVHHHHQLVAAAEKQAMMREVNGHSRSSLAWRYRPSIDHLVLFAIDRRDPVFVLEVAIDAARARVRGCELRLA